MDTRDPLTLMKMANQRKQKSKSTENVFVIDAGRADRALKLPVMLDTAWLKLNPFTFYHENVNQKTTTVETLASLLN